MKQWSKKHYIYSAKKRAGIHVESYLPQAIILTGNGPRYRIAKEIAAYCHKAEFSNTNRLHTVSLSNIIRYHVQDVQDTYEKEMDDARSSIFYLHDFDRLLENPRPSISDRHDWDEIMIDMISSRLRRYNFTAPVIMVMSQQSYKAICDRFTLFEKDHMVIHCRYPNSEEMTNHVLKWLHEDAYVISKPAMAKIRETMDRVCGNKDHRTLDYFDICMGLFNNVTARQSKRLETEPPEKLSKQRLKNITVADVPKYASIADEKILYF
jgi:hypothetical protein